MADDKNGREKQARDADRRQRERDVIAELERGDEPEPPVDDGALEEVDAELEALSFPTTGSEVANAIGDRVVESPDGTYAVAELIPNTDVERFESPGAVRGRVQRPTVAAAMKRIVEASTTIQNVSFSGSQRDAYEKTLRELKAVDAVDDDEGIRTITDWILERIDDKNKLPGSRAVRREAAKICRASGYEIRNDEWLGV